MQISGPTLKTIREFAGLSQAELARRSKVSQGHISALEAATGPSEIRPGTLKKLAAGLNAPMAALVHHDDTEAVAS